MAHPIPTAKSALKTILAARPAWAAVDIRDGQWTETEDVTRDAIWFEATEIPLDGWRELGARSRRVEFNLRFTITTLREGDDERSTEDAMWVLLEDLMAAVKANPSLGGVIQQIDDLSGTQTNSPVGPSLWESAFRGYLACTSLMY